MSNPRETESQASRSLILQQRRLRSRRMLLLFGSLTVAWLVAEGMLALLGIPTKELEFLSKQTQEFDWDCYSSNPRGYFKPKELSDGRTIYCVDHSNDPPRIVDWTDVGFVDHYKVLTVGDSFTWGFGVEYRDSYPYRLQSQLAEESGQPVIVSNYAHVGRMVREIYEEMRLALAKGVPDLCIYGYVLNDPVFAGSERTLPVGPTQKASGMDNEAIDDGINRRTPNLEKYRSESIGGRLRQYSRVMDLAFRGWERYWIAQQTLAYYHELYDPEKNATGLRITWDSIEEMNQLQNQAGKRFLVVIFPLFINLDSSYPFEDIHAILRRELETRNIAYVDLLSAFKKYRTSDLWVHPLDRHPNEVAHRVAAAVITRFLIENGWLEK